MHGGDNLPARTLSANLIVRVLGSAAGGGFPQWNCQCPGCRAVRDGTRPARARTQSSLAICADGREWFIINASPDIHVQLERLPRSIRGSVRAAPMSGIILTDAELDHTLGLVLLRESSVPLCVYATAFVRQALVAASPITALLGRWCGIEWRELTPGTATSLSPGLEIEPFDAGGSAPRYVSHASTDITSTVGLVCRAGNRSVILAPCLGRLDGGVVDRIAASDCALLDGTCWDDGDLVRAGAGERTCRDMGHLPLSGADGSLAVLAALRRPQIVLTHINNTNPILIEDSPERRKLNALGIRVAHDGFEVAL